MSISLSTSNFSKKTVRAAIIKSVAKNLLIFSPLIMVMMFINYRVDPGKLFKSGGYEKGIAVILLQGLNVANIKDCDERLTQRYYIEGDKKPKDIIVLGSSRALQINANILNNERFFNHSVSGATLEDFFAVWGMYEEKNSFPNTVILGLDPWILNKNNGQDRWKSISAYNYVFMDSVKVRKEHNEFFYSLNHKIFQIKKMLSIVSPSYFQTATHYLIKNTSEMNRADKVIGDYYPTRLTNLNTDIKLADGTMSPGEGGVSESLKYDAKTYISNDQVYSLGKFYELNRSSQQDFEKFVDHLYKRNINVVFFLTPYHPYVYNYFMNSTKYCMVAESESYFRMIGNQKHIPVIGSYDPMKCGLVEEDFCDGMHPNRRAVNKLAKLLVTEQSSGKGVSAF